MQEVIVESDRELLEMAANAAGYDVVWNPHWKSFQHRNPLPDAFGQVRHPWGPLDDDGDVLRLAVKLHICLLWPMRGEQFLSVGAGQVGSATPAFHEPMTGGEDVATRRVIVRAAAGVWREMHGKAISPR